MSKLVSFSSLSPSPPPVQSMACVRSEEMTEPTAPLMFQLFNRPRFTLIESIRPVIRACQRGGGNNNRLTPSPSQRHGQWAKSFTENWRRYLLYDFIELEEWGRWLLHTFCVHSMCLLMRGFYDNILQKRLKRQVNLWYTSWEEKYIGLSLYTFLAASLFFPDFTTKVASKKWNKGFILKGK